MYSNVLDLPASASASGIDHADGSADYAISPELACHYDRQNALVWTTLAQRNIPSFTSNLLDDLDAASRVIESRFAHDGGDPLHYVVLRSRNPHAFSVGGDLGYFQRLIASQDRGALGEYARKSINVMYRNYTAHNLRDVSTIALLEADALGGGFECALSCDHVIMERHAKAGFPEVLFDMFPGMGGVSFLRRRVHRAAANEIVRSGRQYSAQELFELGVVDQVVPTGEGAAAVAALVRRRANQLGGQGALNAVDRMVDPVSLQELNDVVRLWVERAMQLSPRALEWMQRLYQRQLAIFGRPMAAVGDVSPALVAPVPIAA